MRYAAFLRGIMPMYVKMPDLTRAFEAAGFDDVRTLLSSGNVVFSAPSARESALQKKAEAALTMELGKPYLTIVRSIDALRAMLASDPWRSFQLKAGSKRVVTFLREPPVKKPRLPVELEGARIFAMTDREAFTAYVRTPRGQPSFMTLIERHFGKDQTTRTWDTVSKVAQ